MRLFTGKALSIENPTSVDITTTKRGLKIEGFSLDSDINDYIFYIDYAKESRFYEVKALYTYHKCLEEMASPGSTYINIYRTITK